MLPPLASAVGGAALAAVALWTAGGQLAESGAQWQEPGPRAVAIGLTALAFAWRPRAALLASIVAGSALVGLVSPGAAIVLGAIALVTLAIGWHTGRLTLLPAACPLLFALGLGPLYAAVAGLVPRWRDRLWVATAGVVATLVWQVAAGADGLMAGGGHLAPGVETLDGQSSPLVAARRLWDPLAAHPEALAPGAGDGGGRHVRAPGAARTSRPAARGGGDRVGGARGGLDGGGGHGGGDGPRRRGARRAGRGRVGPPALAGPAAARPREGVRYPAQSDRMSLLRNIEQKIEGLFERGFRRAFRSSLQPVELARKLGREMEDHKTISVSRVYVPNEFTVYLAPPDRESFASYEQSLVTELAAYLESHARSNGLSLVAPAVVTLTTDEDLRAGEFGIACRMADAPPADEAEADGAGPARREPPAAGPRSRAPRSAGAALPAPRGRERDPGHLRRRRGRRRPDRGGPDPGDRAPRATASPSACPRWAAAATATSCWPIPTRAACTPRCATSAWTTSWWTWGAPTARR